MTDTHHPPAFASMTVAEAIMAAMRAYLPTASQAKAISDTPRRWFRALLDMTSGYEVDTRALLNVQFDEVGGNTTLVECRDVAFASVCEHHLLPFHGTASVAYVPASSRVVGLSKLARLIDAHARRLQVQERMAEDIANDVWQSGVAEWVAVDVVGQHACLTCRGAAKAGATMRTRVVLGTLPDRLAVAPAPAF